VKTVSRNVNLVAYKASADVVSKTVTLVVTVAAARVLAPEAFGVLALAMTTGWLLGVASDAGLPLYLARSVARGDGSLHAVIRAVMRLRILLAIIGLVAGVAVAAIWAPASYVAAFLLIVIAQLAGAVLETLSHVYRGLGRSEIESTLTLVQRLLTALLAGAVLYAQPSLFLVSIALAVPPVLALAVSFGISARLVPRETVPAAAMILAPRNVLRDAAPIGFGILVSALYFRCDVYFLNYWRGLETVGMYNAVFRLVEAMRLLPAAVLAVVFPELCRATTTQPMKRLAIVLGATGLLAMAFTFTSAEGIVHLTYGEAYYGAVNALRILSLSLPFFFLNYALTHQVIAWDGQRRYLAITCAALAANVIANVLLIPRYGMVGAAWATLLTELVVAAGCLAALRGQAVRSVRGQPVRGVRSDEFAAAERARIARPDPARGARPDPVAENAN
jgi:O-antigen/teichoic acid export membrane protein